ncbi:MAG: hypothetical protein QOI58_3713 [Thermoanaerobaculia bacterium]|nr:hypothetical protein [Thermoanaerobaculia bacterium]
MQMRDPTSELRQKELDAARQKQAGVEELPSELNLRAHEVPFEGGGECPDIDFQYADRPHRHPTRTRRFEAVLSGFEGTSRRLRTTVTRM